MNAETQSLAAEAVPRAPTFRSRIINAGLWTSGGFAAQRALQLGSNLVLTRLLFPEVFGLMALANVFMIALAMFSDVGIKPAVVQSERGEDIDFLNTAWTIQVVRGFALWLGACAFAYPASLIYKQPVLLPLICVLGSTSAILGFSSISLATSERRLLLKQLTLVQLAGQAVSLTLNVALAWYLRSVWALAFGGVAGSMVSMVFSHLWLPHHPHRLTWHKDASEALVRFGRWILFSTALGFMAGQGLRMLQGLLLTPAEFGVLSIAQTMATMPSELLLQVIGMAIFPALSEARFSGHHRMLEVLGKAHGKLIAGSAAAFIGLAFISVPLIHLMYDHRYWPAGPQLALLALSSAAAILPIPYQNTLIAMGNTRLDALLNLVSCTSRVVAMFLGFRLAGIAGMIVGIGVGTIVGYLFVTVKCRKYGMVRYDIDAAYIAALITTGIIVHHIYNLSI